MTLDLGILLSLACAFVANLGFFYKYRGANSVASVDVRHPLRSIRTLFSSGWFAIGMIVATASWALHVAALALAPMSVVQVALAAGVVLIAVMADRMFGLVFSVDVIHHVASRADYYREAWRVLRNAGTVCTVTESETIIRRRLHSHYFPDTIPVELGRYPSVPDLRAWMDQAKAPSCAA